MRHWAKWPRTLGLDLENHVLPEVGTRNFFLSPQSQLRNLKETLPQSQFRNFLKNVAPQPQFFLKSATSSSQLESFTSAIFGSFLTQSSLKLYSFYRQVFFAIERILKGEQHEISGLCLHAKTTVTVPKAKMSYDLRVPQLKNFWVLQGIRPQGTNLEFEYLCKFETEFKKTKGSMWGRFR